MGSEDNTTAVVVPLAGWGTITGPDRTKELREYRRKGMEGSPQEPEQEEERQPQAGPLPTKRRDIGYREDVHGGGVAVPLYRRQQS